ncbi:MAG: phosphoribosyl-AMP cyclohydrolase [Endomicrobiales bacterium]|nr:phosphoribosyl-AMP cyclohydrolase [Endomicrobiales bacterium]
MKKKNRGFINKLKFDSKGLIPVVVQDWKDNTVLMVAYMNKAAVKRTLKSKKATYWSRSRNKFWVKGEQSGNIQKVKEIFFDCDGDCLLLKVDQVGKAACHTGYRTCFFTRVINKGKTNIKGKRIFDPKKVYKN